MSSRHFQVGAWTLLCATATAVGCMLIAPLGERGTGTDGPVTADAASSTTTSSNDASGPGGASGAGGSSGTSGASGAGGSGVCTKNSDCSQTGGADEPHRCRDDHTCVALKSPECPVVFGKADDDNAIFFGAFATLDAIRPESSPILYTYRLAQDELSGDAYRGLPVPGDLTTRRPLVMIGCNSSSSAVDLAMQHLVGDGADAVGVPAILANLAPGDLIRAYTNNHPGQTFFVNPVGSTRALLGLGTSGMMWHMLGQPSDLVPAYVELLRLSEQWVRDKRSLGSRPIRVAVVSSNEAYESELSDFVVPALRFNGLDVTSNGANYLGITIDVADPKLNDNAFRICTFKPDIVVSTAGAVLTQENGIIQLMETSWAGPACSPLGTPVGARPFYILSPTNYGNLTSVRAKVITSQMQPGTPIDPEAYQRFVGISAARAADPTLYNNFARSLPMHFPGTSNLNLESENYYDAFYYMAYAMYGAGSVAKLTGPGIAEGMLRLIDGTNLRDVGPLAITDVYTSLAVPNSTIRLNGTLGPASFTRSTGARVDVGSVYCIDQSVAIRPQALRYDPTPDDQSPGHFTGNFPCFSGFFR